MLGRFIRYPKFRALYGQACDYRPGFVVMAEHYARAERRLVKLKRLCSIPD